jgi:probable rRNA maturation factor
VSVFVSDEQSAIEVDLARCVRLAQLTLVEERVPESAEVALIFVDEDAMVDLNRRFLDGAAATDVLAFPIDDDVVPSGRRPDEGGRGPGSPSEPEEPPVVLGDVVICPTVAARQAPEHIATFEDELSLLVVHGILHLLSYDHADAEDAQAMRRRERELLERFRQVEERAGELS